MSSGTSIVSHQRSKGHVLLQYRYNVMSFYSLLVRDPKRGWIVATESTNARTIVETGKTVSKSPQFRTQVLMTDGNSRNVAAGLDFVKQVNGRGLAKVFGFRRLSTVHT